MYECIRLARVVQCEPYPVVLVHFLANFIHALLAPDHTDTLELERCLISPPLLARHEPVVHCWYIQPVLSLFCALLDPAPAPTLSAFSFVTMRTCFSIICISSIFTGVDCGWVDPDTSSKYYSTKPRTVGDDREYTLVSKH